MKITVKALFDAHHHLRAGGLAADVSRFANYVCEYLVWMPNLIPSIVEPEEARLQDIAYARYLPKTKLIPTLKLTPATTPKTVRDAHASGIRAFKLYPADVTTHSDDGIPKKEFIYPSKQLSDVLSEMERLKIILLQHGEMPGEFCMEREAKYHQFVRLLATNWPGLRMTLEHITDARSVELIRELQTHGIKIAGTITTHHLLLTLDDVVGDKLRPDNFCKPIAKTPADRAALFKAATSGEPYFFFGSDSAPHRMIDKYCSHGCAGVFSAPVMLETLIEMFTVTDTLKHFDTFAHDNALNFYGMNDLGRKITLTMNKWSVARVIAGIVPFRSGEEIVWQTDIN